jgi:hypothetical protein
LLEIVDVATRRVASARSYLPKNNKPRPNANILEKEFSSNSFSSLSINV